MKYIIVSLVVAMLSFAAVEQKTDAQITPSQTCFEEPDVGDVYASNAHGKGVL